MDPLLIGHPRWRLHTLPKYSGSDRAPECLYSDSILPSLAGDQQGCRGYIGFEVGIWIMLFPRIGIGIKLHSWSSQRVNKLDLGAMPFGTLTGLSISYAARPSLRYCRTSLWRQQCHAEPGWWGYMFTRSLRRVPLRPFRLLFPLPPIS